MTFRGQSANMPESTEVFWYKNATPMQVSAVIPTKDRSASLERLLQSLSAQLRLPNEVLIVDAGDVSADEVRLKARYPRLNLSVTRSIPAVCYQRNIGIHRATSDHILLCDDDMELPPTYLAELTCFLESDPACGAVSGIVLERDGDSGFVPEFREISTLGLLHHFLFQLPVWSNLSNHSVNFPSNPLRRFLMRHYAAVGNGLTCAGWPLVTQAAGERFETRIHGLGASIVRREWLLNSPFDEVLDSHGIGENYGVALNFPHPITVLTKIFAIHHRSESNRLAEETAYFRRVLALHYFMLRSDRFSGFNRAAFVWSLLGNLITELLGGSKERRNATIQALGLVLTSQNPYYLGFIRGEKQIEPTLK